MKSKITPLSWTIIVLTFALTFATLYLHEYLGSVLGALCFLVTLWEITRAQTDELASAVAALDEDVRQTNNNRETIQAAEKRLIAEHADVIEHLKAEHHEVIDHLNAEHDKFIRLLTEMGGLDRSIQEVARMALTSPILQEYLDWLRRRNGTLLELPRSSGSIRAPDPDYFTFAAIILANAQKCVLSTSLVDPHWYDSNECEKYIQDQVNNLIKKEITFTRYFIVSPKLDTRDRKHKTVEVIKHQALAGFVVGIVHTNRYEDEIDAAVIDEGHFWVRATVPKQNHQDLPGSITGCDCYFRRDPANNNDISELEGYFARLETRKLRTFNQANAASIDQPAIYT